MKMDLPERCAPGRLPVLRQTGAPRAGTPGVLWKRVYPAIYRYRYRYRKIMAFGHAIQKNHLDRISAMLTGLGGRGYLSYDVGKRPVPGRPQQGILSCFFLIIGAPRQFLTFG